MKSVIRFNKNKKGIECLNCKQPISDKDNFCSNCGQVNDLSPLSIKQYLREFLSGFFAFDTRTFNTIFPLLFKPGKVTSNYINGIRMRYVNPFQLYLHTSIIFFLVISLFMSIDRFNNYQTKKSTPTENDNIKVKTDNTGFNISWGDVKKDGLKEAKKHKPVLTKEKLTALIEKNVDTILTSDAFKKALLLKGKKRDDKIAEIYINQVTKFIVQTKGKYKKTTDTVIDYNSLKKEFLSVSERKFKENNIDYQFGEQAKMNTADYLLYDLFGENTSKKIRIFRKVKSNDVIKVLDSLEMPRTKKNIYIFLKTKEFQQIFSKEGKGKRREVLNSLISKMSVVLFFTLPIFTLFLSLIYIRRKFNYTEHLIFTFNTQTVFFILLLLATILNRVFNTSIFMGIALLYFTIYLYKAMKRFYGQGKLKTFLKYFMVATVYLILVVVGSFLLSTFVAFIL